jgi:hypothetical protein
VASARRIRGVKKELYDDLLKPITSKDGWSHDEKVMGDNVDASDNLYFEFTVDRIWGLLMQCATGERVAAR